MTVAFGAFPVLTPPSLPSLFAHSASGQWFLPSSSALCPADPLCLSQELHLLVRHTQQQARARQQAQEHEAERLRIEIVKLREALEEETAARASLEGQLRAQREETGGGRASHRRVPWVRHGQRRCSGDPALTSLSLFLSLPQMCWRVSRVGTLWRATPGGLGPRGPDSHSPCSLPSQPPCVA